MRFATLVVLTLLNTAAVAGELRVPIIIDQVTVYLDRAEVMRTGSVDLPRGASTLLIEELPAGLDPSSVAVKAEGPEGLVIASVETRRIFGEALAQPRERELQGQLQKAEDERTLRVARKAALDTQAKFIEGLAALPTRGGKEDQAFLPPAQWPAAWEAVGRGMAQTNEARTKAEQELRSLDERIERLRQELAQLQTGRRDSMTAAVHLEAARSGRARVALTYQITGAGWSPAYDARLDSERGRLAIQRGASVQQTTGEAWQDVVLTVATGRPSAGAAMPELSSWWIGFYEPRPMLQKSMPEAPMERMMDLPSAGAVAPAEVRQAEAVGTDFSARYRIPGRITLAPDGSRQHFVIGSHEMTTKLTARTTPKLDPRAFLFAEFTLDGADPFLGGRWRLVRDGMFVGDILQPTRRPGEAVALAFGADDAIQVDYKPLADSRGDSGLFGKRRQVTRQWQVTVTNGHRAPLPVTVFDQLPVSRDEDLEVRLVEESTAPSQRDVEDRPGVLAWRLDLGPGKSGKVRFGYDVTYPEGKTVSGL